MENFVTTLCKVAIAINGGLLIVSIPYARADLACLSIINIALLSTHFLFKEEHKE